MLSTQWVRPGRAKSSASYRPVCVSSSHTIERALYEPMPSACGIMEPPPGPMQRYPGRLRAEAPAVRHSKSRSAV